MGETNAGSLGPSVISLTPRERSESKTSTAFCSYQAILYETGQFVDANTERFCERLCNHDERVAVIALPGIEYPGNAPDGAEVEMIVAVLGTACGEDDRIFGQCQGKLRVIFPLLLPAIASGHDNEAFDIAALDCCNHLVCKSEHCSMGTAGDEISAALL